MITLLAIGAGVVLAFAAWAVCRKAGQLDDDCSCAILCERECWAGEDR